MAKLKQQVTAAEGTAPYNTFDSILEIPNGTNPEQNAWLTLQLRVKLNFVDSSNPLTGLTVVKDKKLYAKDSDGYLFEAMDWPPFLITRFQKEYAERAEDTWNWQFILKTPKNYSDLDYQCSSGGGYTVRPNVLCLFRMSVMGPKGAIDTSPMAGPMCTGIAHRTINVVNLSYANKQVNLDSSVTAGPGKPAVKNIAEVDGLSWRSNADNYDDSDLFKPAWWQKEHNVLSNTVGHEVGHALGQCHIMGLKGDAKYIMTAPTGNDAAAYGIGSSDRFDAWNIMGGGDRLYLINAVSWRERIAKHTGVASNLWEVTGMMNTPTRKLPLAMSAAGKAPKEW